MVTAKASRPTSRDEFEIAIVCTKALEYDAVCLLLDDFWDTDGDTFGRARGDLNTYTTGSMGKYNIVVVLLCGPGKATAASAAASLRSSYSSIELLLLIGICAGIPNINGEELLLGDVIISETVVQYDLGSQDANEFREWNTLENRHGRANKNVRGFIASMKTELGYQRLEEKVATHLEQIQKRASGAKHQQRRKAANYQYPGSLNDTLFRSTYCHRHYNSTQCACADYDKTKPFQPVCDESRILGCEQTGCKSRHTEPRKRLHQKFQLESSDDQKAAQQPAIFFGKFGCGDTAISSGAHRDYLAQRHNIIAFEMEGAGVWDELPCIIVKGVSDYGDGHKMKSWHMWQSFAAATAASVSRGLVERYPQTDKSPVAEFIHQTNKACLNDLFITNPEDDKKRIEETKGGLLLDVYNWILRNEAFTQWLNDLATPLMWIKGDPGKGKTMLLCGIINELKANPCYKIYYFLCQATDTRLNNMTAILRGLLHTMIWQQPSLISYIKGEYDKLGKSMFEDPNSWIVLSRIFLNALEDRSMNETIFVIDALDECVTNLPELLDLIVRSSSSSSRVKWLVSSRNEADIHEMLALAKNKSTVSLELNAKSVSAAIAIYIRHKVQLLSERKGYGRRTRDDIERYLADNASGTFLWVALVCALLEKVPRPDALRKLAEFPPGLDQLYKQMIHKVCGSNKSDIGKTILAIATIAYRPLTLQEFVSLIDAHDYGAGSINPSERLWEELLGYCGSFLTMRNYTIYFIHQSAKDFLVERAAHQLFPNGMEYINGRILKASISAMTSILKKDMYGIINPGVCIDDLSHHNMSCDPLIPIRYCCVYWIEHFEKSIPQNTRGDHRHHENNKVVYSFLREKYVHWLEAMSLLKCLFEGMSGMQKLERLVAHTKISGLKELVWDARRFIQMFGKVIAEFPLQVYLSALLFSPAQSIIRQLFRKEASRWIQKWPNSERQWDPCVRKFDGHRGVDISQLAVSYCGTWLASAPDGDAINIWEIKTGKITRKLKIRPDTNHGDYSLSSSELLILFSPWDYKEFVSSWSKSTTIIIWDVTTGKILHRFEVRKGYKSISFLTSAPNLLVCLSNASDNSSIFSTWNTKTGQMVKNVRVPRDISPWHAAFSPKDGSTIAYKDTNDRVEIINIDTDNVIHEIEYAGEIEDIIFSPDGIHIAVFAKLSVRNDSDEAIAVTLTDITSNENKWTYKYVHENYALLVSAFSVNGSLLATVAQKDVHIIETISGKCLQKIIMASYCLVFSPIGRELFSNGNDSIIDVVEVGMQEVLALKPSDCLPEQRNSQRDKILISPSGKCLASIIYDLPRLEVMNINSNITTHRLKIPKSDYADIIFSPDSQKLAFMSDLKLFLWDISSKAGKVIFVWKSPSSLLYTDKMVFSSNSQRLAAPLCYETAAHRYVLKVKVWDTGSGERVIHLVKKARIRDVLLCFSPDNRRIAISWVFKVNKVIRVEIWDIASGTGLNALDLSYDDGSGQLRILNSPYSTPSFSSATSSTFSFSSALSSSPPSHSSSSSSSFSSPSISSSSSDGGNIEFDRLRCLGNSYLLLDILWHSDIRAILRTETDHEGGGEFNDHMLCLRDDESFDMDDSDSWLTFNGERFLWIPPQYRTGAWDTCQAYFAISDDSGFISVIQFCYSAFQELATTSGTPNPRSTPCLSGGVVQTHMQQLDDWIIEHFDMNPSDDKMMSGKRAFSEARERVSIVRRKVREKIIDWKWRL